MMIRLEREKGNGDGFEGEAGKDEAHGRERAHFAKERPKGEG